MARHELRFYQKNHRLFSVIMSSQKYNNACTVVVNCLHTHYNTLVGA